MHPQPPEIATLLARWDSPEGHPYKGKLIDWNAYKADPDNIGCMCAQGQVLHLVGGMTPEDIYQIDAQSKADDEVARLLGISRAHAVLLRNINDSIDGAPSIVLTHPEKVLGDQAPTILAFWRHVDRMTADQWDAAGDAAWDAARGAARAAAWDAVVSATAEIMGAAFMRERGQPFFFLPMFGFADPEAVVAADAQVSA